MFTFQSALLDLRTRLQLADFFQQRYEYSVQLSPETKQIIFMALNRLCYTTKQHTVQLEIIEKIQHKFEFSSQKYSLEKIII